MKSILNTLDILLGHLAAGIMTFLLYLSLGSITVFCLVAIPFEFLEESNSISELDAMELGLFILLAGVIWRFYRRSSQLQWSWWQKQRRFVYAVSSMVLLISFIELVAVWGEVMDKGRLEIEFFNSYEEVGNYVSSLLIIIAIYASAPLPKLWPKKSAAEKADEQSVRPSENVSESISSPFSPEAQGQSEVITPSSVSIEVKTIPTTTPVEGKL